MNIYVGNLNYKTSEQTIKDLFEQYGTVHSVRLITDRETGRKKGFGFVVMDDNEAETAIKELDRKEIDGRTLRVNPANDKPERTGNGGRM